MSVHAHLGSWHNKRLSLNDLQLLRSATTYTRILSNLNNLEQAKNSVMKILNRQMNRSTSTNLRTADEILYRAFSCHKNTMVTYYLAWNYFFFFLAESLVS